MDMDSKKPRNLVIQFDNRTRNMCIAKKTQRHGRKKDMERRCETSTASVMTQHPFISMEHLTFEMKNLVWRTKEAAREKQYEFVWTKVKP